MRRGEIWWCAYGEPFGSEAGYRRPTLIVSANVLNESKLLTVSTVAITGNLHIEHLPTNVRLPANATGLSKPSVAQLHLLTVTNKRLLTDRIGRVPDGLMAQIDDGLRLVLGL
jgi:mRNA interferase MazF